MKIFRRFALASTIGTYLVIYVGGLVRVSGAGLGCPDWPTCFGRWIPPTSLDQLPENIDPSRFNIVLAWIEYVNRVLGMSLGILILITAILAIKYAGKYPKIMWSAIVGAFLVAVTGLQGMVVISSELEPAVVTVHMLLALLLASVMIYTTQQTYYISMDRSDKKPEYAPRIHRRFAVLWLASIVQILSGTQIRSRLEILADRAPLLSDIEWLNQVGWTSELHSILGMILAILTWNLGYRLLVRSRNLPPLVKQATLTVMILITLQIVIGIVFFMYGIPELARVFHLWIGSILVGLMMVLFLVCRKEATA